MNKRVKAFFSMGMVSIFQILLNIIRNKLTAVILGTYGIGVLSIINNIFSIVQPIGNLGINNGIVKKISDDTDNKEEIKCVISTSYITTIVTSTLLVILMIIFSKSISLNNLNSEKYYIYIIIIALALPFTTFNSIESSMINGFKEIRVLAKVSIVSNIVNILISVIFIYFFKISGAIYSIIFMSIFGYIINLIALKKILKKNHIKFIISFVNYKSNIFKTLIAFGSTSIFALIFSNISMLVIRNAITQKLGMNYTGIFQADWAIMNQYIGIVFSSCGIYYFPALCSLKTNHEKIEEINKTLEMLLLVIVPLFVGILCFKDLVINILYSNKFNLAADLLSIFIIGDYFKVIAWTIGYVFAPINKIKEFIVIDLFSNLFFALASVILLDKFKSLYGVAYAYVMLNVAMTIVYYIYLKINIKFEFRKYVKKNILISLIILIISYSTIVLLNIDFIYKIISNLLILSIWFKLVINSEKKLLIKKIINKKVFNKI